MPSKNIIKQYAENSFYHVYNRGVEKRTIFEDEQDYKVFLKYLKDALSSPPSKTTLLKTITFKGATFKGITKQVKNFQKEIELIAYCLMPNHFHFLIKQHNKNSMKKFMTSLSTRYSMYFNKRHSRIGHLFQNNYKACLIKEDAYLLHLSRYIHLNPKREFNNIANAYSSYGEYLGIRNTSWINTEPILDFFKNKSNQIINSKHQTYQDFVENWKGNSSNILGNLTFENDL